MKLLLATTLVLGLVACCAAQPERSADHTHAAAAYKEWVDACKDTGMPDPNEPRFRKLLALPDADLFFLEGLHGQKQTVRRTSVQALALLKTERSYTALVAQLGDANMFRRETAVGVIAGFKQERCIPILLNVLANDSEPQVRVEAVHCLSALSDAFEDKRIEPALRYALKKDVDRVAVAAAQELGRLNSNAEEVIRLTFDLARRVDRDDMREMAAIALVAHRDKLAVAMTIQLLQQFGKRQDRRAALLVETIAAANGTLYSYVAESSPQPVPMPATPAEWVNWWNKAAPHFTFDMRPKPLGNGSVAVALAQRPDPPKAGIDFQRWAREAYWSWDEKLAGPAEGIRQADKYTIVTISRPADRSSVTFKVLLGDKEVYSWEGHTETVFRILRDRLYYARFSPISTGGSIVTVDLATGKTLWESNLLAIGSVSHSSYSNQLILEANTEVVWVRGYESLGRYIEVKDVGTGKTVGHRIFPRQ